MNTISPVLLLSLLCIFIFLSAFCSYAEAAFTAVNRYKLKQLSRLGTRSANRVLALQAQPKRLIGALLICRLLSNLACAQLVAVLGYQLAGLSGVAIAGGILCLVLLLLCDAIPKTFASAYPLTASRITAAILEWVIFVLWPLSHSANAFAQWLLSVQKQLSGRRVNGLSADERRVLEANVFLPLQQRQNQLGALSLDDSTVNDIMIPRQDVIGINLDDDIRDIENQLRIIQHTRIPLYRGELNNTVGILHVRNATRFMGKTELSKAEIMQYAREPYYIPEGTSLQTQLLAFQKLKRRYGLVVDEYGDVMGVATLEDILEEVVGEFTTNIAETHKDITQKEDGTYLIEGSSTIRDINRTLDWSLPNSGPRTLNGLILEHLESIPESPLCLQVRNYQIEILQTKDNAVKIARVWKIKLAR